MKAKGLMEKIKYHRKHLRHHTRKMIVIVILLTAAHFAADLQHHNVTIEHLFNHFLAGFFETIGLKLLGDEGGEV